MQIIHAIKRKSFNILDKVVLGKAMFKPPYKFNSPLDYEARFVHVVNGHSNIISPRGKIALKSGDSLIMKSGNFVNHWMENKDDSETAIIVFQLFPDILQHIYNNKLPKEVRQAEPEQNHPIVKIQPTEILTNFIGSVHSYIEQPEFLTEDVLKLKIKELLHILAMSKNSEVKAILQLFHPADYKFQEIIQANLYENLKLEDLAFLAGMSTSTFQRKFKTTFGTSPKQYILTRRLEKAKALLEDEDLRVSEIAFECGFEDVGHFSKSFSARYGISPKKARNID